MARQSAKKPSRKKARSSNRARSTSKHVYSFGGGKAEGTAKMKELLGGKGANLAEMAGLGLPVPPGFTITTEVCTYYYQHGRKYPTTLRADVAKNLRRVESIIGAGFGDPKNPLLVSVRSGRAELHHEDPATTHLYIEADLAMKEAALRRVADPTPGGPCDSVHATASSPPLRPCDYAQYRPARSHGRTRSATSTPHSHDLGIAPPMRSSA